MTSSISVAINAIFIFIIACSLFDFNNGATTISPYEVTPDDNSCETQLSNVESLNFDKLKRLVQLQYDYAKLNESNQEELKRLADLNESKEKELKQLTDSNESKAEEITRLTVLNERTNDTLKKLVDLNKSNEEKLKELTDSNKCDVSVSTDFGSSTTVNHTELPLTQEQLSNCQNATEENKRYKDRILYLAGDNTKKMIKITQLEEEYKSLNESNQKELKRLADLNESKEKELKQLTASNESKAEEIKRLTVLNERIYDTLKQLVDLNKSNEEKLKKSTDSNKCDVIVSTDFGSSTLTVNHTFSVSGMNGQQESIFETVP